MQKPQNKTILDDYDDDKANRFYFIWEQVVNCFPR